MPGLTVSGNELTDTVRSANTQGDGLVYPDGSHGIWEATTNLWTNGGFETDLTGWTFIAAVTGARVTERAKFGGASCKSTRASVSADTNMGFCAPSGLSASTTYTFSLWVWVPQEWGGTFVRLQDDGSYVGATLVVQVSANLNLRNQWQRIWVTYTLAVDVAGNIVLRADDTTVGRYLYFDGFQAEQQPLPTPYVETNGVTASRSAARVQMPSSHLDETQLWVAARVRSGWGNTAEPQAGLFPGIFDWRDDADNRLSLFYDEATNSFAADRYQAAVHADAVVAKTLALGEAVTLVAAWTSTQVKLSVNGAAFATDVNANIPTLAATLCDLGTLAGNASFAWDGEVLWFACGQGTLTDADAADIHALAQTINGERELGYGSFNRETALCTAFWDGVASEYAVPFVPKPVLV